MVADPDNRIAVGKRQGFRWLAGRAGRREYWLYVGLLVIAGLILRYAPPIVPLAFNAILILVQVRRLHDLGRSGWWAAWATLAPLILGVLLFYVAGEEIATLVGVVLELILVILIGAWPGDPEANRFGPPPPFGMRRALTGR